MQMTGQGQNRQAFTGAHGMGEEIIIFLVRLIESYTLM